MELKQSFVVNNPCYKINKNPALETDAEKRAKYTDFQKNGAKGLMLHSVGCPQPSASVFVNNWNKSTYDDACVHAFIDGNTGVIYQCLPWNFRGWHGGGASNNTHIGVEMCEPACIKYTGGSSFTCSDLATARAVATRTYNAAVEFFAYLCKELTLDPLADGVIISHSEGYKRGVASNHGDPEHLWKGLSLGYTMNGFRKAVAAAMSPQEEKPAETTKTLYRVQTGAFSKKANATALAAKLKAAGFDTYMVQSGGYYKVQVGAYSKKANADAMAAKLKAAGYDTYITTKSGTAVSVEEPAKKTVDELAREVIAGKWGNGATRKQRLTDAGYDYSAVQKRVNELLK